MAASEEMEQAGNAGYHENHMGAIFKEGFSFSGYERDLLALNVGADGFLNVSGISGVDSITDGRGSLFADFDNDGDPDIFMTTVQREAFHLFRNNVGQDNNFIRVELVGTTSGRDAFGSVVRVTTSSGVQAKLKSGGSGFLSQSDPRLLFGLGAEVQATVEVVWPSGQRQRVEGVQAGSSLRWTQGDSVPEQVAERRFDLVDPLSGDQALLARLNLDADGKFPDVALRSSDGSATRLSDVVKPTQRTLVNLWATWCVPCAEEMPELQLQSEALRAAGVGLAGISVDLDTAPGVPAYLAERDITYPIYVMAPDAIRALYARGETQVPLTLVLDDQRRIIQIHAGWNATSHRAVLDLLD